MNTMFVIAGLLVLGAGLVLFYGAVMNSDWLFAMRRSRLWVALLGRTGAQIVFGVIGFAALFGGGFLAVAGVMNVDTSGLLGTSYQPRFFDGGVQYRTFTVYLMPPPPNYTPRGAEGFERLITREQFANHRYGVNWGNYENTGGTMPTNDDILALISREPDFSTGWVVATGRPNGEVYVYFEFVEVNSPTDWKFGHITNGVRIQ